MSDNPTLVFASLDEKKLKESIDSLVTNVNEGMEKMLSKTNETVDAMERKIKELSNLKIGDGSTNNTSSNNTKNIKEETKAIEDNISAKERQKKADKELQVTMDETFRLMRQTTGNAPEIRTTDLAKSAKESFAAMFKNNKELIAQLDEKTNKQEALNKKIKEEAELIRREMAESGKTAIAYNGHAFYQEGKQPISKRVVPSIEEQLLKYYQEEAELKEKVAVGTTETATETNQQATAERAVTEQLQQQLTTEQAISQERKSRVKTQSSEPTVQSLIESKTGEKAMSWTYGDSVNKLTDALRQYQSAYANMTEQERRSPLGKQAVDEMQELERHLHKVKQEMSRPVSFEAAMKLPTSSIDDLMFKIQMLEKYKRGLNFDTQGEEIKRTDEAIRSLNKDLDKYMSKGDGVLKKNTALGRSWNYMKNRLAFYFTVGASTQFIKQLADVRSQYELNEKALGVLVNSAAKGTKIFNQLSNMSLISPYTLIELSSAAKQLVAFNIAGNDVVETTRRLADMASAVGAPMERLTYALGQVKAYGYLNSRDARMFANTGIPLVQELANRYTELRGRIVSTAEVYDMMKKKAISYADVMGVVNKMTDEGGKFFNFQAKMADTLKVKLANFNLAYNNMLNDMGRDNQGTFDGLLKAGRSLMENWRQIYRILSSVIVTLGVVKAASAISTALSSVGFATLRSQITSTTTAAAGLKAVISSIPVVGWIGMLTSLASYFIFFNNSADELKQKLKVIADSFNDMRKQIDDAFVAATSTDNFGTQLAKLKEMVDSAKNDLGIVIPIKFEEINEKNIEQKLNEVRDYVYKYINFAQLASDTAAETELSEGVKEYGNIAQKVYTEATENINTLIAAMTKLNKEGRYTQDIDFLKGLKDNKENKSKLELLEELNKYLLQSKYIYRATDVEDAIKGTFELDDALKELGVKNNNVFENLTYDYNKYIEQTDKAQNAANKFFEALQKQVDIKNMPIKDRQIAIETFINTRGAEEGWNDFTKQFVKKAANQKFGIHIKLDEKSKEDVKVELEDWQKSLQDWCNKNDINLTATINFKEGDTPASIADQALQEYKKAKHELDVALAKGKRGTGSYDDVLAAQTALNNAKKIAYAAGADLEELKDKKAERAAKKARTQAESELQKALKEEITLINNARSSYDKLAKAGYKNKDILSIVSNQFGSTIAHINKVLGKNGIPLFDINSISGADNPKLEQKMLKAQIEAAKKARRAKPSEIKDLEVEYSKVTVDAKAFDFSQLTKQLENKANMLKDEYELSLEISSDPNLGNLFLNAFDINIDTLPSTAKEYADMLTDEVNKYLKGKNVGFTLPTINLTKDDIAAFEKLKDEKKISEEVYNTLVKYSKTANDAIKKENISTAKSFNTLYSQYADLDTKLTKVLQDTAAEQLTLIKKFGSSEDIKTALNLIEQMSIDATPADINRLSKQLVDVTNRVAKKAEGKGAIKLYNAINTKNTKDVAKTTWDDFKDSEYYSMMFDNMEKLSVKSISEIMAKLDELKDKVKEDPASMKALMDAYNNAEKELIKKKPFDSIIKSLIEWRNAAKEVKLAQENLDAANIGVKRAEIGLSGAQALGDKKAIAEATERLAKAQEKQSKATKDLRNAENKEASAQNDFVESLNASASACSNVSSMLSQVVSLLGIAEDSDAAVVINDIAKAFSVMSTVLGVVATMAVLAQLSLGWIGWAATALAAIVGLLSSITNAKNNKINKQIKESELAVKRLENTYKNLEDAINNAFGASITGAKQAAIENKKLQLVELERQLQLEQSRTGKHYDADKVEDLKGKVIDLRNELKNSIQNLSSDLLGIQSVGDAAQNFMKDYIEALRKGEDAQKVFAGSFKDMIATMITQLYVAKVVAPRLQEVMDSLNQAVTDRTKDEAKAYQDAVALQTHYSTMSNDDIKKELARQRAEAQGSGLLAYFAIYSQLQDAEIEELKKEVDKNVIEAKKRLDKASVPLTEDMDSVAQQGQDMLELMKQSEEGLKELLNRYDLYDDGSDKNLSALQQGIQGITEDTAGALEAYMNGVSQQMYLQSDILTQIRDTLNGFDMDAQVGTLSQMLLQMQQSYQIQMSIKSILEGTLVPSGRAFAVELIS